MWCNILEYLGVFFFILLFIHWYEHVSCPCFWGEKVKKNKKDWHGRRTSLLGKCRNIIMVIQTAVIFPDKDTCTFSLFKLFDSRNTHSAFPLNYTIKSSAEMV